MPTKDLICIGVIGSPHGVQGFIKIKNYSENPKGITSYGDVYNENGDKLNLKYKGISKNLNIFKVENINNRDDASRLRGQKLFVERQSLPRLTNGDVYHIDIIGLNVMNLKENKILGKVDNISNFGAGDILEISNDRTEYLVPLLSNDIQNINLDKKFIRLSNIDKWININD